MTTSTSTRGAPATPLPINNRSYKTTVAANLTYLEVDHWALQNTLFLGWRGWELFLRYVVSHGDIAQESSGIGTVNALGLVFYVSGISAVSSPAVCYGDASIWHIITMQRDATNTHIRIRAASKWAVQDYIFVFNLCAALLAVDSLVNVVVSHSKHWRLSTAHQPCPDSATP